MGNQSSAVEQLAQRWRRHCRENPERFAPQELSKRLERQEERLIGQLVETGLPLSRRATAFRWLLELRGCTARAIHCFFGIEPAIVIRGISLLAIPDEAIVRGPRGSAHWDPTVQAWSPEGGALANLGPGEQPVA